MHVVKEFPCSHVSAVIAQALRPAVCAAQHNHAGRPPAERAGGGHRRASLREGRARGGHAHQQGEGLGVRRGQAQDFSLDCREKREMQLQYCCCIWK